MTIQGMPREFELAEILTEEQISHALRLYGKSKKKFHAHCLAQIVEPNLLRITEVLGPCSTRYVAYGIEYRCLKASTQRKGKVRHSNKTLVLRPRRRWKREVNREQWTTTSSDQTLPL